MKVPPKRKGNPRPVRRPVQPLGLNESPSEKEGKSNREAFFADVHKGLNESPSEKEGKCVRLERCIA